MTESESKAGPRANWFHSLWQIIVACLCLYWFWHSPAPNKAVLIITGVTIVMALFEMRTRNKAVYLILVVVLMFIENHAIDKDRRESANAEAVRLEEERQKFQEVVSDLRGISQDLTQLTALSGKLSELELEIRGVKNIRTLHALEAEARATREQIEALVRQTQSEKRIAPSPSTQVLQIPSLDAKEATISSAPPIFHKGEIVGKNFGDRQGYLYIHFHIKDAVQRGIYADGGLFGPDHLLGGLDRSNNIQLSPDQIASWSDTSIKLNLPEGFWNGELEELRSHIRQYGYEPPLASDIEVGYRVQPYQSSEFSMRMGFQRYFYPH